MITEPERGSTFLNILGAVTGGVVVAGVFLLPSPTASAAFGLCVCAAALCGASMADRYYRALEHGGAAKPLEEDRLAAA